MNLWISMKRSVLLGVLSFSLFVSAGHGEKKEGPSATGTPKPKDEMNSGLVYGDNHAFWVTAPKGWVLDNESGVSKGLYAVFYPKGSSWAKSPVVMYANTTSKTKEQGTLQKMIDGDVAEYRDDLKTKKIVDAQALPTGDKDKKAVVKHFLGDNQGNYEACAYIDESKIVVFLVISAKSQKEFESSLPAFKELVASYSFFSDKVTREKDSTWIGDKK